MSERVHYIVKVAVFLSKHTYNDVVSPSKKVLLEFRPRQKKYSLTTQNMFFGSPKLNPEKKEPVAKEASLLK